MMVSLSAPPRTSSSELVPTKLSAPLVPFTVAAQAVPAATIAMTATIAANRVTFLSIPLLLILGQRVIPTALFHPHCTNCEASLLAAHHSNCVFFRLDTYFFRAARPGGSMSRKLWVGFLCCLESVHREVT